MKLSTAVVVFATLVAGSNAQGAQSGCANLIAASITQFFASLEYSTVPDIDAGVAGSLKNIKVKGLNNVKISELTTNEDVCNIQKLVLSAQELEINAQYVANQVTIPNLVSGLTGSGDIKIVTSGVTLQLNLDLNLVNCFEIKDASNLIPSISTGKITLSGNPEKEGEVNSNAINWVTNDFINLLNTIKPQLLQFIQPHITQALNCNC